MRFENLIAFYTTYNLIEAPEFLITPLDISGTALSRNPDRTPSDTLSEFIFLYMILVGYVLPCTLAV